MEEKQPEKIPDYGFGGIEAFALLAPYLCMQVVAWVAVELFGAEVLKTEIFMVLNYLFTFLLCIASFDFFVVRQNEHRILHFNMKVAKPKVYVLIFPLMLGGMLSTEFFSQLIPTTGNFWGKYYQEFQELYGGMSHDAITMLMMTGIFAPVLEEIIFRGIIQKGLMNKGMKPGRAIFISALIFGAIHFTPWQFVGGLLMGAILGYAYYKTGSLLSSILLHSFNNVVSVSLMMFAHQDTYAGFFKVQEWVILTGGILLMAIFGYLFFRLKKPFLI